MKKVVSIILEFIRQPGEDRFLGQWNNSVLVVIALFIGWIIFIR